MFKFSTLASVISVWELLHSGDAIIINTYKPLEVYTAIAGLYIAVIVPATYFARRIETHPTFAIQPGLRT
jgi:polar amino acid transport system permease protein